LCDPITAIAATAAVITAGGAVYGGMAANAQGKYEQRVNEQNAQLEERSRRDAISRGETDQLRHYRKLSQALGEARVRNSAAGLDVSFGSAADLESDIALMGYEDSAALAENTNKEVMGYDINAANYRMAGKAARMRGKAAETAGWISGTGTLLGAASQIGQMNTSRGYNVYGGRKAA
jgi:hypothetical protein